MKSPSLLFFISKMMGKPSAVRCLTAEAITVVKGFICIHRALPAPLAHSLVAVHDGVQPVGDGDGGAVGELLLDGYLDEVVCLEIYCSSGLIHDQNLGFPKQSPGQAQQLPLPYAAANGKDQALAQRTKEQAGVGGGTVFLFQIRL